MTEPKDFYKDLIANPETAAFMKTVYDKAESYGIDKNQFLNYLLGSIASMYDSMEMLITNLESVKYLMLMKSLEQGLMLVQDIQRETDKSEAIEPV